VRNAVNGPLRLHDLVGDVDGFASEHWGRRPMLRPTDIDVAALLDVEAAERLLVASARRPTFRLVQDGERLPPERSTTPVRMGGETLTDVADVAKVADAVGGGATLVLQALQRTWPPLIDLCRQLERELSHPVQANAYLTPARAQGLARHADEHDVLVLQSSGHKTWDVEGLGEVTLRPGDLLYLPAGTDHTAAAQDEASLHLTIGILRVTWGHVVRRLLDRLDEVDLRDPLPLGFATPGRSHLLQEQLADHLRKVVDALASADAGEVARHEHQRAARRPRPLGAGRLQSVVSLDRVEPSTVVVADPDNGAARPVVPSAPGRIELQLVDRSLDMPDSVQAAVAHLARGDEVKVGELPGLDDASRIVLVRRLLREGWLRIVEP
jgi:hypothetical protein